MSGQNPTLEQWTPALVGLLLFAVWTGVVRTGISERGRHAAWAAQRFGVWPSPFGAVAGSGDSVLSIQASYGSGGTLGSATIGTTTDFGDSGNMNGSRFVTGSQAGSVSSMSVHVAEPIDTPPRDQFQVAIYSDIRGAPGTLLAQSASAALTANAWNTVAVSATLMPRTAYWLMYATNGSTSSVNNLTFTALPTNPLDRVIRKPRSDWLRRAAGALRVLGNPAVTGLVVLVMAWRVGRSQPRLAVLLLAAFGVGILLELVLKQTLFYPYSSYPSGHSLRAVFLAKVIAVMSSRRLVSLGVVLLALLVGLSSIHPNRHFSEDVIGGALAGWTLAAAVIASRLR